MTPSVAFDAADIAAWSAFSGDTNPIHFDRELAARNFGFDSVVVPGMLAMLLPKTCLAEWDDGGEWLRWKALLRQTLPADRPYCFAFDGATGRFSLDDSPRGARCITGTCDAAEVDESKYAGDLRYTIDAEHLAERLASFRSRFGSELWIALDAVIFANYLDRHSNLVYEKQLDRIGIGGIRNVMELAGRFVVLQSYHASVVRRSLLGRAIDPFPARLEYSVHGVEQVASKDGFFAVVSMPVWLDGELALIVDVGITTKLAPQES